MLLLIGRGLRIRIYPELSFGTLRRIKGFLDRLPFCSGEPNNPTNVSATSTSVNIPGMGILFDGLILKALSPPPKDTVTETNFNLNVIYEF